MLEKQDKLRLRLPREFEGRRQWNDGARGLIESKLGDVLASLEVRASELDERQRVAEERRRLAEEAREQAFEDARTRFAEAFKVEALGAQVADLHLSDQIRTYCSRLRRVLGDDIDAGTAAWVAWAEAHADLVDPLLHPPAMPEVPVPGFEDLRPFLRSRPW